MKKEHLFYSARQAARTSHKTFGKLKSGEIVEHTEICSKKNDHKKRFEDSVYLGEGEFDHIEGSVNLPPSYF